MRRIRSIVTAAAALALCANVAACGTERTPEAFCAVMQEHKTRYLKAMDTANDSVSGGQAVGVLGGLSQAISAVADLQQMWNELADVAPDEIRGDVEAVRDANQAQLDGLEEAVDNPLRALGSALIGGLTIAGPMGRIDTYTRKHCDGGASWDPQAAGIGEQTEASPNPLPTVAPATTTSTTLPVVGAVTTMAFEQPEQLVGDGLLLDSSSDSARLSRVVPGKGGLPSVTIVPNLPDPFEEDGSLEVFAGAAGDSTGVVATVPARAPSDGLAPARTARFLLTFDPDTGDQLAEATLDEDARVAGVVDGLVIMLSDDTLAVRDARSAALVTTVQGVSDVQLGRRLVVVQRTADMETAQGIDPRTGKVVWSVQGLGYGGTSGSRDLTYVGDAIMRIASGQRIEIPGTDRWDDVSVNRSQILEDPVTQSVVLRSQCGDLAVVTRDDEIAFTKRCGELDPELFLMAAFGGFVWARTADERIVFSETDGKVVAKDWQYYPSTGTSQLLLLNDPDQQTRLLALGVDPKQILELTQSVPSS